MGAATDVSSHVIRSMRRRSKHLVDRQNWILDYDHWDKVEAKQEGQ